MSAIPLPTPRRRSAFTLFEVALSLLIVAFSVVSVLTIFPVGLNQLQQSRYRAYAATIAVQLVDVYSHADITSHTIDYEAPWPWDVQTDRRVNAPDLEMRCSTQRLGLMPLPPQIARRLDSDGDEISRLLDDGGYVYYLQPQAPNLWREDAMPTEPPNDLQKLVVGVAGPAQHNASYLFPMKCWPYQTPVPMMPFNVQRDMGYWGFSTRPDPKNIWAASSFNWNGLQDTGPEMKDLYQAACAYLAPAINGDAQLKERLGDYLKAACAYAEAVFVAEPRLDEILAGGTWHSSRKYLDEIIPGQEKAARAVLALSHLTHALTCLTTRHPVTKIDARPDLTNGVDLAQEYKVTFTNSTLAGALSPLTHGRLTAFHHQCLRHYYHFCARYPYNWAVPRPIAHAQMMDHPLLELDLFSPPLEGLITGSQTQAGQWRYMSPTPIATLEHDPNKPFGSGQVYLNHKLDRFFTENGPPSANATHYTMLNAFDPSERCRELVFWAVDWQQYADFETAPSAPVEASRYPMAAPGPAHATDGLPRGGDLFTNRMRGLGGSNKFLWDHWIPHYRNPERTLAFLVPTADLLTGADMTEFTAMREMEPPPDYGPPGERARLPANKGASEELRRSVGRFEEVFTGAFGADRRYNHRLDRGPIKPHVRMRATTVARFNIYDLRAHCQFR